MLQIRTVQSTGTDFIRHVCKSSGVAATVRHWSDRDNGYRGIMGATIRDPKKVYTTWASNGFNLYEFALQWRRLNKAYMNNPDLYILPVDTSNRQEMLDKLSDRIHFKLETDWKPIHSRPHVDVSKVDLSDIYDLTVVKEFYKL